MSNTKICIFTIDLTYFPNTGTLIITEAFYFWHAIAYRNYNPDSFSNKLRKTACKVKAKLTLVLEKASRHVGGSGGVVTFSLRLLTSALDAGA
jgi:hypothetical protein